MSTAFSFGLPHTGDPSTMATHLSVPSSSLHVDYQIEPTPEALEPYLDSPVAAVRVAGGVAEPHGAYRSLRALEAEIDDRVVALRREGESASRQGLKICVGEQLREEYVVVVDSDASISSTSAAGAGQRPWVGIFERSAGTVYARGVYSSLEDFQEQQRLMRRLLRPSSPPLQPVDTSAFVTVPLDNLHG